MAKKGKQGFRTRSGYRTVGDELQALMAGLQRMPRTPYVWATGFSLSVPKDLAQQLEIVAAKRGISAQTLARDLLTAIAEENLFTAVLDDE